MTSVAQRPSAIDDHQISRFTTHSAYTWLVAVHPRPQSVRKNYTAPAATAASAANPPALQVVDNSDNRTNPSLLAVFNIK